MPRGDAIIALNALKSQSEPNKTGESFSYESKRAHRRYNRELSKLIPDETPEFRIELGRVIDCIRLYEIRHINNPDAIAMREIELRNRLGRNWEERSQGIIWTKGKYRFSPSESYTKELYVRADVAAMIDSRHDKNPYDDNDLVRSDGGKIRERAAMKHPLRSKLSNIPTMIDIDIQAVEELETVYSDWLEAVDAEKTPSLDIDGYIELHDRKVKSPAYIGKTFDELTPIWRRIVKRRLNEANTVLELAHAAGGQLPQRYEQRNGKPRYQGIGGGSLQTCHRELRYAALKGQHGYDIKAAHHYIIFDYAEKAGIDCPQLQKMIAGKEAYRLKIAQETGAMFSLDDVKKALLMIVYGARFHDPVASNEEATGLLEAFGEHGQKALQNSNSFMELRKELNKVFDYIIETHKPKVGHRGGIKNAIGQFLRPDNGKKIKRASIVAFILQGIEVQAMLAMLSVCESARVAIHDGIVCQNQECQAKLEAAMFKATDIRFKLEHDHIKGPIW